MLTKTNFDARRLWWSTLPVLLLAALPVQLMAQNDAPVAQTTTTPPAPQPDAPNQASNVVIKKESRLVLVDAVVTDKKGNYIRDLSKSDFKVYEDNKEQAISSFSTGADAAATQANGQRRYLILFFDNYTMQAPDQIQARNAANKFIAANANADHLTAVVDFGVGRGIVQNCRATADVWRAAVAGVKSSSVNPNANVATDTQPVTVASTGLSSLDDAEADYRARRKLLAVRRL